MLEKARATPACLPVIGHRELPDFQVLVERDEVASVRLDAVVVRADDGVAHAVAAGVVLELVARGLPRGRPELADSLSRR